MAILAGRLNNRASEPPFILKLVPTLPWKILICEKFETLVPVLCLDQIAGKATCLALEHLLNTFE